MILIRSLLLLVSFILSGVLYSQTTVTMTLPTVTLMDIEPTGNFTLNFTAPTEAGNALGNPTPNTSKWVNYTSAIAPGGLTRKITASVNKVIAGVNIRLQAAAASGAGGGTLGTSAGQVTLTTTPVTIISGIGGAFTGNGANNGHNLTISLTTNTYANLLAQANTAVVIVYTITE
ncbi:hypothetical protein [Chryseobacterium sp. JV558]|uniref:hypothetical protein n=1 Tax=Chryseobacterium sp. JV558 TaxID=2663236 RepID=UPI00299EC49B|nr:hypothetical protein [Chryseobacterium sp. JV558]MDW9379703.1 hypothetical protein [Chryseobacterium sp. JV558]